MISKFKEAIFDLITDPPCRNCEFWDVQEHYCWLKNMHPTSSKCELINQILDLRIEEGGHVYKLGIIDDGELPGMNPEEIRVIAEVSDSRYEWHEDSYRNVLQAYQDKLAGYRKEVGNE